MRGMILAAGRGQRMGVLTENTPKPLLSVAGRPLIEYSIMALKNAGIHDIVMNVSYLRDQIIETVGDGSRYGVSIHYSIEPEALETGGGVLQALPFFDNKPFIVISSDIITDFPLKNLPVLKDNLAHIVLVDNPSYHTTGDFHLEQQRVQLTGSPTFTFANIGVYHPDLFIGYQAGKFRLGDVLKKAIAQQQVTGEYFKGLWHNMGRPEDLALGTTHIHSLT